jgi:multicomponent Na+:H+ antiporter subunit E
VSLLVANVLLALVWSLMIGSFTPANFVVGLVLGYAVLRLASLRGQRSAYFRKVGTTISFFFYFVWELLKANVRMAINVCSPLDRLKPGIIAIPLEPGMSELEITTLANVITLTPGTLSLDVSEDKSTLFVHFMHVEDPDEQVREVKEGFERRLLQVTR